MAEAAAGAGLVAGLLNNEKNRKDARNARDAALSQAEMLRAQQQPLIDRQVLLYDTIKGIVDRASKEGQFNPDWLLHTLRNDTKRLQSETVGNLAGSMKTLGYGKGDSEIGVRMDSALSKTYADFMDNEAAIRQGVLQNEINSYGQVGNAANMLNAAGNMMAGSAGMTAGIQNGLANFYQGQIGNPAGLIASFMPFLQNKQQQAGTPNNGSTSGDDTAGSSGTGQTPTLAQPPLSDLPTNSATNPPLMQQSKSMAPSGSIVDGFLNSTERMGSNRTAGGFTLADLFAGRLGLPGYTEGTEAAPRLTIDWFKNQGGIVPNGGQRLPWDEQATTLASLWGRR